MAREASQAAISPVTSPVAVGSGRGVVDAAYQEAHETRGRSGRAGVPWQITPGGRSLKTELRAPTTVPSPTETPGPTKTSDANQAWEPIVTLEERMSKVGLEES